MKEIKLIPDTPFHNSVDVAVMDFPKGVEEGTQRQRCKITVEFAQADVEDLQGRGLDMEGAMKYFEDYVYKIVKVNISSDWQCIAGWDEVMDIVRDHVKAYY
jgi:hypothetical protein